MTKNPAFSSHPHSMEDLQRSAGMKPGTFRVWKANNNKAIARGLKNFEIADPENSSRKRFTQDYLERILDLRSKIRQPKSTRTTSKVTTGTTTPSATKTTKTAKRATTRTSMSTARTSEFLVLLTADQRRAFRAIATSLGWAFHNA